MALDRIVQWKNRRPSKEQIQMLLEDFFAGAAAILWNEDQRRWYCELPGRTSEAFIRLRDDVRTKAHAQLAKQTPLRVIEIISRGDHVDVCTRDAADRFTNALAEEIAVLLAWGWKGEREPM